MSDRPTPGPRRWREVIEHLPGGFLIDFDGNRSIERAEVVAGLIMRRWPAVYYAMLELHELQKNEELEHECVGADGA